MSKSIGFFVAGAISATVSSLKGKKEEQEGSMGKVTAERVDELADKGADNLSEEEISEMTDFFEDFIDQLDAEKADPKIEHLPLEMDVFTFSDEAHNEMLSEEELPPGVRKIRID